MKTLLTFAIAIIVGFIGIAWAENEATFNSTSGELLIPKVAVGSDYFKVVMQHKDGLDFSVTSTSPSTSSGSYSIVGSWGTGYWPTGTENKGESEYVSLTFYPNGYYIHYETGQAGEPCDNGGGVEYGTYSIDLSTNTLYVTALVDENGCVGLSENGNPSTIPLTFMGNDQIAFPDGVSFNRVK